MQQSVQQRKSKKNTKNKENTRHTAVTNNNTHQKVAAANVELDSFRLFARFRFCIKVETCTATDPTATYRTATHAA